MNTPFNSIALLGRHTDERVADSMRLLARHLLGRGVTVLVEEHIDGQIFPQGVTRVPQQEFATRARLVIAIGGDGTMLYAAHLVARHDVPLLGVNRGRLGFLTDVSPDDMLARLDEVLSGRYAEDRRTLLDARLVRVGREDVTLTALNDVVLHKGGVARVVRLRVAVDGEEVGHYSADGIIVSTPTGSTAYSLSAGGPIVVPGVDAIVITAICPHTLGVRPLVVPADRVVTVEPLAPHADDIIVSFDGQSSVTLAPGSRLLVRRGDRRVQLVRLGPEGYFARMRKKLQWGDLSDRERR